MHFFVSEVPISSKESRPRFEIRADYRAVYERGDSSYTVLTVDSDTSGRFVTAYLFDARGDSSATLTAHRVVYYDQQERLEAEGNVVVVTTDGRRLESEHLVWLEAEREVRTPGFVRITMPDEWVQGYGLVADENLETYRLERVTAQRFVEEDA